MFARVVSAAAQAVLLLLLARLVGLDAFALIAGLLGVMTFVSACSDLGVTTATTRCAAAGDTTLLGALRRLNRVIGLVGAVVTAVAILTIFAVQPDSRWLMMLPLVVWIFAERVAEFQFAFQVGAGSVTRAVLNLVVRKSIPTFALGVAFIAPVDPLLLIVSGYAIGGVTAICVGGAPPERQVHGRDRALRTALKEAFPFWLNSVGAQARQVDVALVGQFAGTAVASAYAPAARMIGPLRLIPTTLAQAALPHLTQADPAERLSRKLVMVSLAFSVPVYGILIVLAESFITVLLGDEFAGSVAPLRILLAGLVLAGLASLLSSTLQAARREWSVALISVGTALLTLVLLAVLGWAFGAVGAAAAISVGYVVQLLALFLAVKHQKKVVK